MEYSNCCPALTISIHAPAKGATPSQPLARTCRKHFNPRSREGSDPRLFSHIVPPAAISIHAPAKGATQGRNLQNAAPIDFNPRSREGSDLSFLPSIAVLREFQSTLPRRERPYWFSMFLIPIAFQSTLPRRERRGRVGGVGRLSHFNPRSREGSDSGVSDHGRHSNHFNPRSREGSDPLHNWCYW